ncbi:MAG: hypothetical protein J4215_03815 [Candidatus Diapherotrites archaeon]|uniref:Uncharacterized protein n=1 Tax=Candidatus Iainarchaeum sp. TaxID=3101447 RepID=A0A8T4L706_9ARCH|nr:hypothetical protein [Candidatus Diapherotrites archaeon]
MGLLDFLKRPKYRYTPEEVEEKIRQSLVLKGEKTPLEEAIEESDLNTAVSSDQKRKKKQLVPLAGQKNRFLVSTSFKLLPLFVVNGKVLSGVLQKGMVAVYNGELISIKAIQEGLQKAQRLSSGSRGSVEIVAKIGLDIPDGTLLEFVPKDQLKKKPKRRKKARKKKINPKETEITLGIRKPPKVPVSVSVAIPSEKKEN